MSTHMTGTARAYPPRLHMPAFFEGVLDAPESAGKNGAIEGLRGYAVLLVFLVHHHTLFGEYLPAHTWLLQLSRFGETIGHSGVDLFFVLSGFLIYGSLIQRATTYKTFLIRRVRRIYPTFLFVFCLYVLLSHLIPSVSKVPTSVTGESAYLAANLLLLPGIFPIQPLITVTWSLSYEFLFYLSIPLVISLTAMRSWRYSARVVFFVCLFILYCLAYQFGLVSHIRLGMFAAGIVAYEVIAAGWVVGRLTSRGESLAIGLYIAVLFVLGLFELGDRFQFHPFFPNAGFVPWTLLLAMSTFGILLYCLAADGRLKRLFTCAPLRWMGNISYSYFLIHGVILNATLLGARYAGADRFRSVPLFLFLLIFNLASTVAAALIVFLLIERPLSLRVARTRRPAKVFGATAGAPW
jgi:exopolysaccharide production protein ExoZ